MLAASGFLPPAQVGGWERESTVVWEDGLSPCSWSSGFLRVFIASRQVSGAWLVGMATCWHLEQAGPWPTTHPPGAAPAPLTPLAAGPRPTSLLFCLT